MGHLEHADGPAAPAAPAPPAPLVVHELVNILFTLRLRLDLLATKIPGEATSQDLTALRAATDRLATLADSLRAALPPSADANCE